MYIKTLLSVALLAAALFTSGCSNLADARASKGGGVSREYAATADAAWKAVPQVLEEISLPLVTESRQEGYILAQRGVSMLSYGENVAIFIESVANTALTKVEVVSKKAMATNIFAPDWSKEILDALEKKLAKHSRAKAEVAASDAPAKPLDTPCSTPCASESSATVCYCSVCILPMFVPTSQAFEASWRLPCRRAALSAWSFLSSAKC